MTTLSALLDDLEAEYAEVHALVGDLAGDAPEWDLATPAEGWAVRDQISHLAFFDDAGRLAMVEPDEFAALVEAALAAAGDPMELHLGRGRAMGGRELLRWWEGAHEGMITAFAGADPSVRVPWFGPPMGVLSFVSARLMETWAHGQDVADAFGVWREPTDRLRHIAHLGVRARPFSYAARGRDVPAGSIAVRLDAPSGEVWTWEVGEPTGGVEDGHSTVSGPALDFCLVVTQRRNIADTALAAEGELAREWLSLAQAFAGPPGPGRPPRRT